jgi:hypothetical protein
VHPERRSMCPELMRQRRSPAPRDGQRADHSPRPSAPFQPMPLADAPVRQKGTTVVLTRLGTGGRVLGPEEG